MKMDEAKKRYRVSAKKKIKHHCIEFGFTVGILKSYWDKGCNL
jgi:hypothetical protein